MRVLDPFHSCGPVNLAFSVLPIRCESVCFLSYPVLVVVEVKWVLLCCVLCAVCCVLCCLQCKELSPTRPKGPRGKNALHRCVFNTHHQCVIIMSVGFHVSFRRTKGGFYVSFEGGFTCFLVTVHDTLPEGGFTCLLAGCHSYSYCGLRIPRCRSIQRSTSRPPSTRFGTLLLSSYRIW